MKANNQNPAADKALLHAFIISFLLLHYLLRGRVDGKGTLYMFLASIIVTLHIWLGAYYIVAHLKPKRTWPHFLLNIIAAVSLAGSILSFDILWRWALFLCALFTCAIIKYSSIARESTDPAILRYSNTKIRIEIISIPLLILLSATALLFPEIIAILQAVSLLAMISFWLWLAFVAKVYSIKFSG